MRESSGPYATTATDGFSWLASGQIGWVYKDVLPLIRLYMQMKVDYWSSDATVSGPTTGAPLGAGTDYLQLQALAGVGF